MSHRVKTAHVISFLVKCIVLGLAAAFVIAWLRPDLIPGRNGGTGVEASGRGAVTYAEAVNRTAPSVVSIYTRTMVREPLGESSDPLQQYLWGNRMVRRPRAGLGSGVIVSPDGYVLTTLHVIDGVDDILVALWDGRLAEAKVVGTDPATDLAVLKTELEDLPVAPLAREHTPRTGDVVLAIGNAFGLSHTVTMGIVSATGRSDLNLSMYEDLIQTDAAINSGNSGGALVSPAGEVIGINSATMSQSVGAQGISFAIPSDLAREVMDQIIEYGKVKRAWLGASLADRAIAQRETTEDWRGVQIMEVARGGPAWRAGLRPGDVLTRAGGEKVTSARNLLLRIAQREPGSEVEIEAVRNGQSFTTSVTLIQQPPLRG